MTHRLQTALFTALTITLLLLLTRPAMAGIDYSVCPNVQTLPDGEYNSSLRLGDVMDQFQDHLNIADEILRRGKYESSATDADLQTAIDHVDSARNCALLASRNIGVSMKPTRYRQLPEDQQSQYVTQFKVVMDGFADLLGQYSQLFQSTLQTPSDERHYSELSDCKMHIDSYSTQAHSHL